MSEAFRQCSRKPPFQKQHVLSGGGSYEVPFVVIRAILDDASGEVDMTYEEFLPLAAENASKMIEGMIKAAAESL